MNGKVWAVGIAMGAAVALAGCSSDAPPSADDAPRDHDAQEPAGGSGSIDCSAIDKEKIADYAFYVQLLAQFTSTDQLESFTIMGFTPERFDAALDNLEPARSLEPGQFGNPGDAIDFYRGLNDAVAEVLAKGDAVTQADVDAYVAKTGGVDNVISKQLAINGPLSEACPDLNE